MEKNIERLIVGTALAAAASALLPIARPLAAAAMEGGVSLLHRVRSLAELAREEVEDIIAEAQFERMKRQFDKELASLDHQE